MPSNSSDNRQGILARLKCRYWSSLSGRLIALSLALSITLLWALVFLATAAQRREFSEVLFDEQLASARRLAADLDHRLVERINMLKWAAEKLPADLTHKTVERYLEKLVGMHDAFTAGVVVIGINGIAISDYPIVSGRRGTYVGDRDYFSNALERGTPYIDKPIVGRTLQRRVLTISVPVLDSAGNARAVIAGFTDLGAPNFLGHVFDQAMSGKGQFFVISPRDNLIVAATEPGRVMTKTPERGVHVMYDRFVDGFEGSGIATSTNGIPKLYSATRVPASNWLVMAALPAAIAFQPVTDLRNTLILMALALTVVALFVTHWATRLVIAPLDDAGRAMRKIAHGTAPLTPLPVSSANEIGGLIDNFNVLLEDRHRSEAALADSEQRFRTLLDSAPDAISVHTNGRFVYVNAASVSMFGAQSRNQLLGQPVIDRMHPDSRAVVAVRMSTVAKSRQSVPPMVHKLQRLDGSVVYAEVSAVPFRYQNEDGALVFARDITERKLSEEALRQSQARIRELAAHQEKIREEERTRIARDIHDELGQTLLTIRFDASMLAQRTVASHPNLHSKAHLMLHHIDTAMKSVKAIINDLRPFVLDLGLIAALEWQASEFQRASGITCVLETDGDDFDSYLDRNTAAALFRVVQESLTNILRHAEASQVRIALRMVNDWLELSIADNGVGFVFGSSKRNSFGLVGMEERMNVLGGRMTVDSAPGAGATLIFSVPVMGRKSARG